MNPNDLFWTSPPKDEEPLPVDPLGLDVMRDELADRLVPCLTSRTKRHEDFFWTLVFIKWAASEPTHEARVAAFLRYERWLKLLWAKYGSEAGFAGSRRAKVQSQEDGAPLVAYKRLLKMPQSQGMLGAHLAPLRSLGLVVESESLELTDGPARNDSGAALVMAIDPDPPRLRDGKWSDWKRDFDGVREHFAGGDFRRRLRNLMAKKMPVLDGALASLRYPAQGTQQWTRAAKHMPSGLAPYARLAGAFCPWAAEMRDFFVACVESRCSDKSIRCPKPLAASIPSDLERWEPLRKALARWDKASPVRFMADWHREVFEGRGYGKSDLWLSYEDGRPMAFPGRVSATKNVEGDCRWSNAVTLLKPRRGGRA